MTRHLSRHLADLLQIAQNQTSSEETLTKTKIQCLGPNFMTFIYKKWVQSVCVCYFLIDAKNIYYYYFYYYYYYYFTGRLGQFFPCFRPLNKLLNWSCQRSILYIISRTHRNTLLVSAKFLIR